MDKVVELIKSIDDFVRKADDTSDLKELLAGHPNADKLIKSIDDYETVIGKLLRKQKKTLIKGIKAYTAGASLTNPIIGAIVEMIFSDIQENDSFDSEMSKASSDFLTRTVPDLTSSLMSAIDKDIAFNQLSQRTLTWIDEWSEDLGRLMKLKTHGDVHRVLRKGIDEGKSIVEMELELAEMPAFNRNRARKTAITEVLTANSVAQFEAYTQSPAVTGKTWMHSGAKAIKPRPAHVALDGTTIDLEEMFDVNGYSAKYPRDTLLPASERVYCHCVLVPAVDEEILGLTAEEKEIIRQQRMQEMGVI